jgi:hypothetical protein
MLLQNQLRLITSLDKEAIAQNLLEHSLQMDLSLERPTME